MKFRRRLGKYKKSSAVRPEESAAKETDSGVVEPKAPVKKESAAAPPISGTVEPKAPVKKEPVGAPPISGTVKPKAPGKKEPAAAPPTSGTVKQKAPVKKEPVGAPSISGRVEPKAPFKKESAEMPPISSDVESAQSVPEDVLILPEGLPPLQLRWAQFRLWLRRSPNVRWVGGTFAFALFIGYLIAAFILFPGPWRIERITVPALIGMNQSAAAEELAGVHLAVGDVESISHPTAASGQVVWQDPPDGVVVDEGMSVQMSVSHGPQQIPIPDIANYDEEIAIRLLESAGLNVRVTRTQTAAPRGVAVNTRPAIGTTRRPGDTVELLVSDGAPTIRVPDLRGMTIGEATEILRSLGLRLGAFTNRASRAQPPGTIFEHSPPPGTLAAPGTMINGLTVRQP